MKLARKLTFAIIAGILTIMGVAAAVRVVREKALFEADMSRDHRFTGRVLRDALVSVAQSDGLGRAEEMLVAANRHDPHIQLSLVAFDPASSPHRRPAVATSRLAAVRAGIEDEFTLPDRFVTYVPVRIRDQPPMALEVSESLADENLYIRASVLNNLLTLAGIVFVCSILAIALGYVFVGGPMSRLTEKARRVGAGDLTGPVTFEQNDEIAEFAVEMNAMCDRLAEAHARIEEETTQRIAALEQLRHADRLRTVGQLASGLAHELGTPLNVVLGRARLLLAADVTPDEAAEHARAVADQATRMTALIRQLLDFARPRGPQFQSVDLNGIATQTSAMLSTLGEKRHVAIEVKACDETLEADADPMQLQQALTNLMVNAIQAMDASGKVVVTLGRRRMQPPADHGGDAQDYRFISVEDHGPGIAAENLSRIFEPFFTTKGVGEGTGLGLSVTYGIVRDHDGWIEVKTTAGTGSTFTIYLPRQRRDPSLASNRPRISVSMFDTGSAKSAVVRG